MAAVAAEELRRGWLEERPGDEVVALPLADGGEGTLEAIEAAAPTARREEVTVDGPAGALSVPWLLLEDGTAVVELAVACGLPLWPEPDPFGAHTGALGQVLRAAAEDSRVRRIDVAVGGSASTDGGTGALAALGADFVLAEGDRMPRGAARLESLDRVELGGLVPPPADGVRVLTDVTSPLLGPDGAAAVFGPQKGASPDDVRRLDDALAHLAAVLGGAPDAAGAGAAGGTAYGLATVWGAAISPGAPTVGELVGLPEAVRVADIVITGEGQLDSQSVRGKVIGHLMDLAEDHGTDVWACVGAVAKGGLDADASSRLGQIVELVALAGSVEAAMGEPRTWLRQAGQELARRATVRE